MTQNRNSTRYYSALQEKELADILDMRQQVNSGATTFDKGDVYDEDILLDAKTTIKAQGSFSLKEDWFQKVKEEAFAMGKMFSGIAIRFSPRGKDYIALPVEDFKTFYEAWKELNK